MEHREINAKGSKVTVTLNGAIATQGLPGELK